MSGKAQPTVCMDNDHVRAIEWAFALGNATGWHRHEFPYVITPVASAPIGIADA